MHSSKKVPIIIGGGPQIPMTFTNGIKTLYFVFESLKHACFKITRMVLINLGGKSMSLLLLSYQLMKELHYHG